MKQYNILSFGADPTGTAPSTDAIQSAIDACAASGGEVILPQGTFLSGDILLRDNVTLHLLSGATLLGSRDPMDYFHYRKLYALSTEDVDDAPWSRQAIGEGDTTVRSRIRIPGSRWNNALIRALYAQNVAVIGDERSVIDGADCYDPYGEEHYRGPHGMTFFGCTGVTLRGYTIRNTGNWAHNVNESRNLTMENVTVLAGHDGIHMSMCENITIRNSGFYTGDDCIAGFANINVLVEGCEINSACSAFRFGGTNLLAHDCHLFGPGRYCFRGKMSEEDKKNGAPSATTEEAKKLGYRTNMLSAFTYYSDYSLSVKEQPGNIILRDCKIEMADRLLHYNFSGNERWQANRPLSDLTFERVDASGISMPLTAYGDKNMKFNLHVKDVSFSAREGSEIKALIHACNYDTIELRSLHLNRFDGECLVRTWSAEDSVTINEVSGERPPHDVLPATEPFFAKPI